jgi:DNA polymerase sigma
VRLFFLFGILKIQVLYTNQANDISAGSYNYLTVKSAFRKAYIELTAMIGSAFEKRSQSKEKGTIDLILDLKDSQSEMISLLGSIIQISRSVLEQRDFVELQYEKYLAGTLEDDAFGDPKIPSIKRNFKRKRDINSDPDVIYVDEDDLEKAQNTTPAAKRKRTGSNGSRNGKSKLHKKIN